MNSYERRQDGASVQDALEPKEGGDRMKKWIRVAAARVLADALPLAVSAVVIGIGLCVSVTRAHAVIDIFWWLRR
jgi:hypothetical protein